MRTRCFALLFFAVACFACSKEQQALPQPIKNLIAASGTNCTCLPFIDQYMWRGKTVYLKSCAGPACDCMTLYYDEAGIELKMESGYMPDDFKAEAQLVKNVWRC